MQLRNKVDSARLFFWFFLVLAFILQLNCSKPSQPDEQSNYLLRTTPENVLANLELAYNELNCEKYLDCLAEDFRFYSTDSGSWDKKEEERIHRNMFNGFGKADEVILKLSGNGHFTEESPGHDGWRILPRQYHLTVKISSKGEQTASSSVVFLLREQDNLWQIVEWRED
jgi:hypothetical protein